MFGNLIPNRQLRQLINSKEIQIHPFNESNLKSAHYTLRIGRIFSHQEDGELVQVHSFKDSRKPSSYELKAHDYVVVEAFEHITLSNSGIVGRFIAVSSLIESGLDLISGQISNSYGMNGEVVRFGLKNLRPNAAFIVDNSFRIAHVEFFDLRGITPERVKMTTEEQNIWDSRKNRANDDGVIYDGED